MISYNDTKDKLFRKTSTASNFSFAQSEDAVNFVRVGIAAQTAKILLVKWWFEQEALHYAIKEVSKRLDPNRKINATPTKGAMQI